MKKKLNLIKLQKEEMKDKEMTAIRGGGYCGCVDDGILFNRRTKRDKHDPPHVESLSQD